MVAWTAFLLWGSLFALAYTYVGYPVLVWCLVRLKGNVPQAEVLDRDYLPKVTVLIAAYNAEHHVRSRIENLFASDYPADRLRVVIASDGSDDATVDGVRSIDDPRVTCFAFQKRRGKARTLVHAVERLGNRSADEVLLFTDVTTRFASDAVLHLASNFQDPAVGLVSGHVTITDPEGQPSESLYWKCEMMVRRCEARLGIMLGASGAIYAMRFPLFVAPTSAVINDDMVFPTLVRLRHGVNVKLDENARAFAIGGGTLGAEFHRRRRIGVGAVQCLFTLKELFHPKHGVQLWAFTSHKLLRWASPLFLIVAAVANVLIHLEGVYQVTAALQIGAYGLAVLGVFLTGHGVAVRLSRAATSFVVMNAALAAGILQWVLNPACVVWTPTHRPVVGREGLPIESAISLDFVESRTRKSNPVDILTELPRKAS
ncbi:Glycosyltransferase, catalytic subunit of cellulose synthase and poly-beta-1,6-N-acetylglucosamine synthase [Neorhodopirellula lusitana]|uniref:Glycosyltransferase, catalytic subunit of cellulose synthase and poly-beta-1,6-N-acetylglucosamine synthase n=1 Tax=Neorhodopirellula lusitana TaxID=445327 RepID=A0ABY1PRW4_9BACT|nr:glycosyltransferase [Neorhodopirellula lusitana]SMP44194.1 Glycosyltransferase, catalytic subunit of cellulose synthase and poly-beta-1,6-N-acetylglucosamine synthase [Neorhodopirellula lusitana]